MQDTAMRRLLSPDNERLIEGCPAEALRSMAAALAEFACDAVDVGDSRASAALDALRLGRFRGPELRGAEELTQELDEVAWDLQERIESDGSDQSKYVAAFKRARAVATIVMAFDDDPRMALLEAA